MTLATEASMGFIELLLLPLLVSYVCAVELIFIGIQKRSAGRIGLGIVQLSVFVPIVVAFVPSCYQLGVTLGQVQVAVLVVAVSIQWAVYGATRDSIFSLTGIMAFGAHVYFLANAP